MHVKLSTCSFPCPLAPSDYLGGTYRVTVPAGSSMANLSVPTIKNDSVEVDEVFKATLTVPLGSDSVVVGMDTAYVAITDTSGECLIICSSLIKLKHCLLLYACMYCLGARYY